MRHIAHITTNASSAANGVTKCDGEKTESFNGIVYSNSAAPTIEVAECVIFFAERTRNPKITGK